MLPAADREIRLGIWKIHILHHAATRDVWGAWLRLHEEIVLGREPDNAERDRRQAARRTKSSSAPWKS